MTNLGVVRRTQAGLFWLLEREETQGRTSTDGRADQSMRFGSSTDRPVAGRWISPDTPEGRTPHHIGVVRATRHGMNWLLETDVDAEGRQRSDGRANLSLGFGSASRGDLAVVGDWDRTHVDNLGVARGNLWFLESDEATFGTNGRQTQSDGAHDGAFRFGTANDDTFLVWHDYTRR